MGFVELHFHLLPGADDGPVRMTESIELARAAVADGTSTVITTPHVHPEHINRPAEILPRIRELTARLHREEIRLEVLPGAELWSGLAAQLTGDQLDLIAQGPRDARWILLEGPLAGLDTSFTAAADRLRELGFGVLLAHPERYHPSEQTSAAIGHELAAGSGLQLNAWSFMGINGDSARATAFSLLDAAAAVVVSSDAHGAGRPPVLQAVLTELRSAGVRDPERFVSSVPRMLIQRGLGAASMSMAA